MKYIFILLLPVSCIAQGPLFFSEPLTHTYSIVARDPATGEMGVAVQSHWFSVGSIVSWAQAGAGAIATQSLVNPALGQQGLVLLKQGKSAQEVLETLISKDEGRAVRQFAVVDALGRTAAWTGENCIAEAGHIQKENYSVQANMMLNPTVWPAMAAAFENTVGPLAERMLAALEAAQLAGGDIRGQQSAALLVVRGMATGNLWEDRMIDLRVEDHARPVTELKRLLQVHRAYGHMNAGDLATEKNDMRSALAEYGMAQQLFPENLEMKFWTAVAMINNGMIREALPLFTEVIAADSNWGLLVPRIRKAGLLICDDGLEKRILGK